MPEKDIRKEFLDELFRLYGVDGETVLREDIQIKQLKWMVSNL